MSIRGLIKIILIVTTILLFGHCKKEQYQINKEDKLKSVKEGLMSRVLLQSKYSGFYKISEKYKLKTINGDSKYLTNIVSNTTTLVLYINSNQCNSCIIDAIDKIENYLKTKPKMEYIIFSSGFSLRELKLKKRDYNLKGSIYSLGNEKLSFFNKMEEANFPYYFTINSDLEFSNVFFPFKSSSELEKKYFKLITNN